MAIAPELIRRRVVQACLLFVALAAAPSIASSLVPSVAPYFPPFMLSSLVAFSVADALLVWRTHWFVAKLFPGQELPTPLPFSPQERRSMAVSACVGLVLSLALAVVWLRSLL